MTIQKKSKFNVRIYSIMLFFFLFFFLRRDYDVFEASM